MATRKLTGMEASAKFSDWYEQGIRFWPKEGTMEPQVKSCSTIVSTNGYHYAIDLTSDVDNNDAWEIKCGEVRGLYRGDVNIDGSRCVLFADEWGYRFAVLPQNVVWGV